MTSFDASKVIGVCKDFLHAEWAVYKQSSMINSSALCIYAVGGQSDYPVACIESVANGFKELERILDDTVYLMVDESTPLVPHDIMIWIDGRISLFPKRNYGGKTHPSSLGNGQLEPPAPNPGKKPKQQSTPESLFMNCAEQITTYMLDHLKRVGETCLLAGNIKILYYVLASALLVKSRLSTYKQLLKTSTKGFPVVISRCSEFIEINTQHLLNYHSDVIRSCILQDLAANDWTSSKPYEENNGVSSCIQMWSFYMQGIHNDLWRYTSPKVARDMFSNILLDNLGLLVRRYLDNCASEPRLLQMKTDVAAILFVTSSFMFSLTPSPRFLFRGDTEGSPLLPLHRRMDWLVRIAAVKFAPIELLLKVFSNGIPDSPFSAEITASQTPTEIVSCPEWLSFFNPKLFPSKTVQLASLPDPVAVFITLNTAALNPLPLPSLILRSLLMRDCTASKLILRSIKELPFKVSKGALCNGPLCYGDRCSHPLSPHSVYSSIVQIINDSFTSSPVLNDVMQVSINGAVNLNLFDRRQVLDAQVWNKQRAPWHHALVQLVSLYVTPVVAEVFKSIPPEAPAQPAHPSQFSSRLESHITAWIRLMISGVTQVADLLPMSLIHISKSMTSLLPPSIKPLGGHVISHIVVSAIYSIVNSRSSLDQLSESGSITDSQWDMMIALGERLCSLHEGDYDEDLAMMTKALIERNLEDDQYVDDNLDDYTNEETIEEVCQQMADHVMATVQGQHAFGIVWEFFRRNMSWFTWALKCPEFLPAPSTIDEATKPEPELVWDSPLPIYNPLLFYDQILYNKFDHEYLLGFEANWESVLKGDLWMPKAMICDLIKARPELKDGSSQSPEITKLKELVK